MVARPHCRGLRIPRRCPKSPQQAPKIPEGQLKAECSNATQIAHSMDVDPKAICTVSWIDITGRRRVPCSTGMTTTCPPRQTGPRGEHRQCSQLRRLGLAAAGVVSILGSRACNDVTLPSTAITHQISRVLFTPCGLTHSRQLAFCAAAAILTGPILCSVPT